MECGGLAAALRSSPRHRLLTERKAYAALKKKGGDSSPPKPMFLDTLETQPKCSAVLTTERAREAQYRVYPSFSSANDLEQNGRLRRAARSVLNALAKRSNYSAKNKKAAISRRLKTCTGHA